MDHNGIDKLSRSLADSTSRRSLLQLLGVGAAGTAVAAVGLSTAGGRNEALAAEIVNQLTDVPILGRSGKTRFRGKFSITSFRAATDQEREQLDVNIVAIGNVTGKLRKNGKSKPVSQDNVIVPVTVESSEVQIAAICQVLRLVLGPIHLNLLGLILNTNRIVITLRADSEGGLLGSLLCGLAGGVDDLGLDAVIDLLNDILAALTGSV